jgi:hypothetical protein
VANVLLKKRVPSPFYDCWRIGGTPPASARDRRPFTDLLFASWAAHDEVDRSGLTLYKCLPYDGGRPELYGEGSFQREKQSFEAALPEIVRALGLSDTDVAGVRMTRWGHPMPLAERGLIADGVAAQACAPVADRIFFAQQDNWCSPAFEPTLASARMAAAAIEKAMKG